MEFRAGVILTEVFRGQRSVSDLLDLWGASGGLIESSSDAFVFVDHQDTQRGTELPEANILTYKDTKLYKMATAFMLAHPYGITKIMSGFDFETVNQGPPHDNQDNILSPGINADDTCSNGWVCEHRWRQIYNMIGFTNAVEGTEVQNIWKGNNGQLGFSRGDKGFIIFNLNGNVDEIIETGLPSGVYCDIISGHVLNGKCSGKTVTVTAGGIALISMTDQDEDGVLAIHVNATIA